MWVLTASEPVRFGDTISADERSITRVVNPSANFNQQSAAVQSTGWLLCVWKELIFCLEIRGKMRKTYLARKTKLLTPAGWFLNSGDQKRYQKFFCSHFSSEKIFRACLGWRYAFILFYSLIQANLICRQTIFWR